MLLRGHRCFKGKLLQLERWDPASGCIKKGESLNEIWVRVVGLPLHFWSWEVFRKIREVWGRLW